MIEERRAAIEREIENLKYDRKVLRKLYYKLEGVSPEVVLSDIVSDIYLLEDRIVRLRTEKLLTRLSKSMLTGLLKRIWNQLLNALKKLVKNMALHRGR